MKIKGDVFDINSLIKYMDSSGTNKVLRDKVLDICSLLAAIDEVKLSFNYEDLVDEFEFVFYNKLHNDSGKIILTIREHQSKIYIYGCKFLSTDLPVNLDTNMYYVLQLALSGKYSVTEKGRNGKLYTQDIDFMSTKKSIKFGLFRFLYFMKFSVTKFEGINYLKN